MKTIGDPHGVTAGLLQRVQTANSLLLQGNFDGYVASIRPSPDCTLMGPFGGPLRSGYDLSNEGRARMSHQFSDGTFEQQLVSSVIVSDIAVIATVEHLSAVIGGLPRQAWSLRVTQVFRRRGPDWELISRHADPLAKSLSLPAAAALARGEGG